jgi:hypothetical protein
MRRRPRTSGNLAQYLRLIISGHVQACLDFNHHFLVIAFSGVGTKVINSSVQTELHTYQPANDPKRVIGHERWTRRPRLTALAFCEPKRGSATKKPGHERTIGRHPSRSLGVLLLRR